MLKKLAVAALVLLLALAAVLAFMFAQARSMPVVRRADLALAGMPAGAAIRVVLVSDIHIGTPAMDGERLARIVAQVNAISPDLVLIAGDFIFGHVPGSAERIGKPMVAPLAKLRPRTIAVLGNHDHWTGGDAVRDQLKRAGIAVQENEAVAVGPLAIGGVGDEYTGHDDLPATLRAARRLGRPILLFSHSPDIAPGLPADATLLLAGHTHCGQGVVLGRDLGCKVSRYGTRYRCGIVAEGGRRVVVTAGLGTSGVPLRIGAPPDLWLLTLRGPPQAGQRGLSRSSGRSFPSRP